MPIYECFRRRRLRRTGANICVAVFTLNEFNYYILFWAVAVVKYCAQRTRPTEKKKERVKTALLYTFCLRRGTTWFRVEQCGVEKYFTRTRTILAHLLCELQPYIFTACVCSVHSCQCAIEMHIAGVDDRGNYKHDAVSTGVAVLCHRRSVRALKTIKTAAVKINK